MIQAVSGEVCSEIVAGLIGRMEWASLHTEEPDFSSASASEYFAPGYSRARTVWEVMGDGVAMNANELVWDGLVPPLTVFALGFLPDPNGYLLTAYALLDIPSTLTGSVWRIPARQVTLRIA